MSRFLCGHLKKGVCL